MTECNITASTPLLVAIDISKGRHEVLIEVPDKKRRRRVSVLNTLDEFERLITLLRRCSPGPTSRRLHGLKDWIPRNFMDGVVRRLHLVLFHR